MNPTEKQEQDQRDRDDLTKLSETPAFERYFMRRLREEVSIREREILDGENLSESEWRVLQIERKTLLGVIDLPKRDRRMLLESQRNSG